MLSKQEFASFVASKTTIVLDSALATELEKRGHDLNHPLWSGRILQEAPESIQQLHLDYFLAGADVAITASYQAATRSLTEHWGLSEHAGKDIVQHSVRLAKQARAMAQAQGISREMLIAGSVGPYGAYMADGSEYTGSYDLPMEELKDFHRPRIAALVEAGVDLLAIETVPNRREIEAVLDLLASEFPTALAWVSCTLSSSPSSPTCIPDGTPLYSIAQLANEHVATVVAVGLNCVPPELVTPALQALRAGTTLPLICYANSGEVWDGTNKIWYEPKDPGTGFAAGVAQWIKLAKFVGGCCRTGPDDVKMIIAEVNKAHSSLDT